MPLVFPHPDPEHEDPEHPLIPVVLFPNNGGGYGYGTTDQGFQTRSGFALAEGYDRSANITVIDGQRISPSYSAGGALSISSLPGKVGFAIPWVSNTTIPRPVIVLGVGTNAFTVTAASASGETEALSSEYFNDGVLFDNGSGTALIIAGTVTNLVTGAAGRLQSRTVAASWTRSTTANGKFVCVAGKDLWRATTDYQVSKCPGGSDPMADASYGSAFQVGSNATKIKSMGAIGAVPLIGKEDGIYQFVEADSRFSPILSVNPHPLNFNFLRDDGAGGLWSSTYDGSAVHIRPYGGIDVYHPLRRKSPGRDTPKLRLLDAAPVGDAVYFSAQTNAFTQAHTDAGFVATKTADNFSTFTDYLTEGDDRDYTTTVNISSLDTLANGDALLVGFSDKFYGLEFLMQTVSTTNANMTVVLSTGAGTWSSNPGTVDTTGCFRQDGRVMIQPSRSVDSAWVKATYGTAGLERYWWRITTSAALSASTAIGEIAFLPRRQGPAFSTPNNLVINEVLEPTGVNDKIIKLTISGSQPLWEDVYMSSVDVAGRMVVSGIPSTNSPYGSLATFGRIAGYIYPLPTSGNPTITNYPVLQQDELGGLPPPMFYPSAVDLGGVHELAYIEVYANNISQGTDSVVVAARMDDTNPWYVSDASKQDYNRFRIDEDMTGTMLHVAVQLLDGAATDPIGPSIRAIVAWVREADHAKLTLQATRTTPEVT